MGRREVVVAAGAVFILQSFYSSSRAVEKRQPGGMAIDEDFGAFSGGTGIGLAAVNENVGELIAVRLESGMESD